jgi:cysteine desulfurase
MSRLFLDHNATTPLKPQARDAMIAAMDAGNPSSVHTEGRQAKALIEEARKNVATAIDAPANGVIFTSGGTEAINMALWGMVRRDKEPVRRLFVSAVEHDAVINCSQAVADTGLVERELIPVLPTGEFDADWLRARLAEYDAEKDGRFMVCIMLANNENGAVQDIQAVTPLIFQKGGYLFVDATQAFGKLAFSFNDLQADLMCISGHKVGGPKGIGALITKPGIPLAQHTQGGGQELRRRVGTENVIGIAGLGAAAKAIDIQKMDALTVVRDEIIRGLEKMDIDGLRIWGRDAAKRLPNTICFSAPGFLSETQVMVMDLSGIAVSAGSACSSGKVKASHVVQALGASEEEATCTLRVSLGWDTPAEAATRFLKEWGEAYERAVKRRAA